MKRVNQYLVDQICDHHEWVRYISPRKLCYDYEIMTGKNITDEEFAYIDEIGILPITPKDQWIIPKGFIVDLDGNVRKEA